MAKSRVPRILGLHTAPNEVSEVPKGSLVQADNVVVRDPGLVEPRRGLARYIGLITGAGATYFPQSQSANLEFTHGSTAVTTSPNNIFFFNKDNPGTASSVPGAYSAGFAFANAAGSVLDYTPADDDLARTRFIEFGDETYGTSIDGPRAMRRFVNVKSNTTISTIIPVAKYAGSPKPPDVSFLYDDSPYTGGPQGLAGAPSATGSWLTSNSSVSYRLTFGFYELPASDKNQVFRESAPSSRFIVRCPANQSVTIARAGSATVTVTTPSAHNLMIGDIVAISPSVTTAFASGSFTILTTPSVTSFTYSDATSTGTTTLASQTLTIGPKYVQAQFFCDDYRLGFGFDAVNTSTTTAQFFYRLYRTKVASGYSTDPGDEHFLIAENILSTTNLVNGYVDFTDTTPEAGLGLPLYTNPASGESILQANDIPPLAKDMASWGERLWFSNTKDMQVLTVKLLGVGTTTGLRNGDLFVVGAQSIYFDTSFDTRGLTNSDNAAYIFTAFNSISRNIEFTARNIVSSVNTFRALSGGSGPKVLNTSNLIDVFNEFPLAFYNDDPSRVGEMTFVVSNPNADAFTWYSDRSDAWGRPPPVSNASITVGAGNIAATVVSDKINVSITVSSHGLTVDDYVLLLRAAGGVPYLPMTTGRLYAGLFKVSGASASSIQFQTQLRNDGTTVSGTNTGSVSVLGFPQSAATFWSSENTVGKNRLYYSKVNQPEAVPLLNYIDVGARESQILRIHPLNDVLFVFKEDGLFTISGQEPFSLDAFDPTVILASPDSVAALNNFLFALTTKGVVRISTSGVEIISEPIDDLIKNRANTYIRRYAFGVGAEDDDLYYLWLPNTSQVCSEAFVYNTESDAWTRITKDATCGTYTPFDGTAYSRQLFVGSGEFPYVLRERKTTDNATYGFPFNQDYADEVYTVTVSSVPNSTTLVLSSAANVTTGSFIAQGTSAAGLVSAVTGNTVTIVPDATLGAFTTASTALAYTPYQINVRFVPDFADNPDELKHYRDLQLLFQRTAFYEPDATFSSELYSTTLSVPFSTTESEVLLNRDIASVVSLDNRRIGIPTETQRCIYLTVGMSMREAFSFFRLCGYSLVGEGMSERVKK